MQFLAQIGLMFLGSLGILFVRAVWRSKTDGDRFNLADFVLENRQRLLLIAFGNLVIGTLLYFDAGSVQTVLALLGPEVQLGAGAYMGCGIAAVVLIVPNNGGNNT